MSPPTTVAMSVDHSGLWLISCQSRPTTRSGLRRSAVTTWARSWSPGAGNVIASRAAILARGRWRSRTYAAL